jgi:hypothetical protein
MEKKMNMKEENKEMMKEMDMKEEMKEERREIKGRIVFMVGGVGEKFVRPCSLMGYIGYRLHFSETG